MFFLNAHELKVVFFSPILPSYSISFDSYRSCQPIKSIKDVGSLLHPVWNFPAGEVGGKQWSLNDVEDYLRNPQPLK